MKKIFYSLLIVAFLFVTLAGAPGAARAESSAEAKPQLTGKVIYVNASAGGANNGTSWANAYTSLDAAFGEAVSGDQVWVAKGTYKPSQREYSGDPKSARFLPREGVLLYGGFAGYEYHPAQRDWKNNPTILSGNIDGTNRVYTIVEVSFRLTVDGLYFEDAHGNSLGSSALGLETPYGTGYKDPDLVVRNAVFRNNFNSTNGGSISIMNNPPDNSNNGCRLWITNVTFENNSASFHGGAVFTRYCKNVSVANSAFYNNTVNGYYNAASGGAIAVELASLNVVNSIFSGNEAHDGGAIFISNREHTGFHANIIQSNFYRNRAGVTVRQGHITPSEYGTALFSDATNTRINVYSSLIDDTGNDSILSVFAYYFTSLSTGTPGLVCAVNNIGNVQGSSAPCSSNNQQIDAQHNPIYPGWVDPANQNFTLQANSPALDFGDPALLPADVNDIDQDGNTSEKIQLDVHLKPRIDGSSLDAGAVENETCPVGQARLYVNHAAAGWANGYTWANAAQSLNYALDKAHTCGIPEVWVAKGTYTPDTITATGLRNYKRDWSFNLSNGVKVFGGFAGNETARSERDWSANPTILNGDLLGNDGDIVRSDEAVRAENTLHVVNAGNVDTSARLDGFTIQGGNANSGNLSEPGGRGGGINAGSGSPALINLILRDNSANYGGALYTETAQGRPDIVNARFLRNYAYYSGGAIVNIGGDVEVYNAVFSGNRAALANGGVLYSYSYAKTTFAHVSFSQNTASLGGHSVFSGQGSTTLINNSAFEANQHVVDDTSNPYAQGQTSLSYSTVKDSYYSWAFNLKGNLPNQVEFDSDPLFVAPLGSDSTAGTLDDDLRLQAASPAREQGSLTYTPNDTYDLDGDGDTGEKLSRDLAGAARVLGSSPDAGAYEGSIPTSLTLASSKTTTVAGESFTLTASVVEDDSAAPTGPVTFKNGTAVLGTANVADANQAKLDVSIDTPGVYNLTAEYAGDASFDGNPSPALSQTVTQGTVTISAAFSPSSPVVGEPVTITVTVSGDAPTNGTPTGTVTVGGWPSACSLALSGGNASCTAAFTNADSHSFNITYDGDTLYQSDSDSANLTVQLIGTTTSITSITPASPVYRQELIVNFTVSAQSAGAGTPSGTVTVNASGGGSCSGTLTNGAGSCTFTAPAVGDFNLTANYSPTGPFSGSASGNFPYTVAKAAPTLAFSGITSVVTGQEGSVSVRVTGAAGGAIPSGTVSITDTTSGANCDASLVPDANAGTGSCAMLFSQAGSHSFSAHYQGDGNYTGSDAQGTYAVGKASTELKIDGQKTPTNAVFGDVITVYVNVTALAPGSGSPTGSVTVRANDAIVCTVNSLINGTGSCTFTPSAAYSYGLSAEYNGDSNFFPPSIVYIHHLLVEQAPPTVEVTLTPPDPVFGQPVMVNVSVSGVNGVTPTGTVTVANGAYASCPTITLASGSGSCTLTPPALGSQTISALYNGDTNYQAQTGSAAAMVAKASTTAALTSSPNPSYPGAPVTFIYTVTANAPGSGTPTGSVEVRDGQTVLCSGTVADGSCSAALNTIQTYTLQAIYLGDSSFSGDTSGDHSHEVGASDTYADPAGQCDSNIPCFTSFQAAIDAAAPGRTVTVYPGTYDETATLSKDVTVNLNGDVRLGGSLSISAGTFNSTSAGLYIGGDLSHTAGTFNHYDGLVVLNGPVEQKLLINAAVQDLTVDKGSPAGYWKLDEGQGATVVDSSGSGRNGALVNNVDQSYSAVVPTLDHSNSYSLNTAYTYARVPHDNNLTLAGPFTLSAWVYWAGYPDLYEVFLSKPKVDDGGGQSGLSMVANNGVPEIIFGTSQGWRDVKADKALTASEWTHIAASYDGQNLRLYVNGALANQKDFGSTLPTLTGATDLLIGREFQTAYPERAFNGNVDEVVVYNQALSGAKIALLHSGKRASSSVVLAKPLTVANDLVLQSGALDVSANSYPLTVTGSWKNEAGSFIARAGTVTLDGSSQLVTGQNSFYNLTRTTPGVLNFQAGQTQTVTGTLELRGDSASSLLLNSSSTGTQWSIDPQGARTLEYLAVQDSANLNTAQINAIGTGSINLGNNSGWNFAAPAASSQSVTVTEEADTVITLSAADADGDNLTYTVTGLPVSGQLYQYAGSGRGAAITSAPTQLTDGQQRLIYHYDSDLGDQQLTFTASDGQVQNSAVVTLNTSNLNDAPSISAATSLDTAEDHPTTLGFTISDEETSAASLTVTAASSDTDLVPAAGLAIQCTGAVCTLTVTPAADQHGIATLTLTLSDGDKQVTHDVALTVNSVDDDPTAQDSSVTLAEDTTYTFQPADFAFSDADGHSLAGVRIINLPAMGTLAYSGAGVQADDLIADVTNLTFTPAIDAFGSAYAAFDFSVLDSSGAESSTYTLTLNVTAVDDAPVAEDDEYNAQEDTPLTVDAAAGVLANDTDAEGDALEAVLVSQPALGTVTLNKDGSFTYTPDSNVNGEDSFTYQAAAGGKNSNIATVKMIIAPVDDLPEFKITRLQAVNEGDIVNFSASYLDPDTHQSVLNPGDTVEWDFGDGTSAVSGGLTAEHIYANNGSYPVTATVKDGQGQSLASDQFTMLIENVSPLISAGGSAQLQVGESFTRAGSFADPGADPWTATVDYGDGQGQTALALNGKTFALIHSYSQAGTYTVTVRVFDGEIQPGVYTLQVVVVEPEEEGFTVFLPCLLR